MQLIKLLTILGCQLNHKLVTLFMIFFNYIYICSLGLTHRSFNKDLKKSSSERKERLKICLEMDEDQSQRVQVPRIKLGNQGLEVKI